VGLWAYYQFTQASTTIKTGLLEYVIPSAWADVSSERENQTRFYLGMAVLAVIAAAFLISLAALFLLPHGANDPRIKAADNIVKMFGGFFTGLATTLLTKF
jgi:hypothetical protein